MGTYESSRRSSNAGRWLFAVLLLGLFGSILRALAVPLAVSDVDGVNFARSLVAFNPLQQSPHFPGYPVYVALAQGVQALGVSSRVWSLVGPAILLWPAACVLLFAGTRRLFGVWPGLGAVVAASLAPGAVGHGGWPGSDGLGFALLAGATGALGLAAGGLQTSKNVRASGENWQAC